MRRIDKLLEWFWRLLPDRCEVCHGDSGGVRGNENVIDGIIMCDYCTVERERDDQRRIDAPHIGAAHNV